VELDPADPLEHPLLEHPAPGEDVADNAERGELHRDDEHRRAEDERLDVPAGVVREEEEVEEARPDHDADERRHGGRGHEHPERLVHRVDAEDRDGVAPDVGPHGREQARLARLLVRSDRDVVNGHEHLASLDDRLERVGELGDHLHLQRRLAVIGAEAGGRVGHVRAGGTAHHRAAEPLEALLQWREVVDLVGLAVADHHVGVAGEDRAHQLGDVAAEVLVVGVRVDDDVGAQLQRRVEPRLERGGQAPVVGEPHHVLDAVLARHLDRPVAGTVVDHQPLDLIDALDLARQIGQRGGKC
jgi:hypothetical protein